VAILDEGRADLGAAPPSEEHLRRALAGDEAAFVVLYRGVNPGLVRYLRVLVGQAADDVAAEAWAQACRDLRRFSGDLPSFRAWIARIGRNRAIDHLRAERRRPVLPLPLDDLPEPGLADAAETTVVEADATREAIALIRTLPPDQAEAVLLRAVLGLDAAAAGQVLGKRPGAVRTAAYRGLRTLAERLTATDAATHSGAHSGGLDPAPTGEAERPPVTAGSRRRDTRRLRNAEGVS
jgi:RNA polymerase sigma-70 factor (ECF subfamily)